MSKKRKIINKDKYNKKCDLYSVNSDSKNLTGVWLLEDIEELFKIILDNNGKNNLVAKKNDLYCGKCASGNIYQIPKIVVYDKKNKKNDYKKYWFVLRKISDSLKEKILFMDITYDKTKSDLINSIWAFFYFIAIVPISSIIPYSIFANMDNFPFVFKMELIIITFIFFIIVLMNYLTCRSARKKYYNTYCCPHCGRLFMPQEYRVRLKKNTSIFVKMHLFYNRLTRRKFYNVRYVSYQVEQEMKKLGMR